MTPDTLNRFPSPAPSLFDALDEALHRRRFPSPAPSAYRLAAVTAALARDADERPWRRFGSVAAVCEEIEALRDAGEVLAKLYGEGHESSVRLVPDRFGNGARVVQVKRQPPSISLADYVARALVDVAAVDVSRLGDAARPARTAPASGWWLRAEPDGPWRAARTLTEIARVVGDVLAELAHAARQSIKRLEALETEAKERRRDYYRRADVPVPNGGPDESWRRGEASLLTAVLSAASYKALQGERQVRDLVAALSEDERLAAAPELLTAALLAFLRDAEADLLLQPGQRVPAADLWDYYSETQAGGLGKYGLLRLLDSILGGRYRGRHYTWTPAAALAAM